MEHYLSVVADKTGSLIATSGRFGAMLSGARTGVVEMLTSYGERIGVAFQLSDDLLDVASEATESGKTPGTDLREGVATLARPARTRSDDPADARLRQLLDGPIGDDSAHAEALGCCGRTPPWRPPAPRYAAARTRRAPCWPALPDVAARSALESLVRRRRGTYAAEPSESHGDVGLDGDISRCQSQLGARCAGPGAATSAVKTTARARRAAKPMSRAAGSDSWKTKTPSRNCSVGVMYCRIPIVDRGTREAPAPNSSNGMAVIGPAAISSRVLPVLEWPKVSVPLTCKAIRSTRQGTKRNAASLVSDSRAGMSTIFLTSPYVANEKASTKAMTGGLP